MKTKAPYSPYLIALGLSLTNEIYWLLFAYLFFEVFWRYPQRFVKLVKNWEYLSYCGPMILLLLVHLGWSLRANNLESALISSLHMLPLGVVPWMMIMARKNVSVTRLYQAFLAGTLAAVFAYLVHQSLVVTPWTGVTEVWDTFFNDRLNPTGASALLLSAINLLIGKRQLEFMRISNYLLALMLAAGVVFLGDSYGYIMLLCTTVYWSVWHIRRGDGVKRWKKYSLLAAAFSLVVGGYFFADRLYLDEGGDNIPAEEQEEVLFDSDFIWGQGSGSHVVRGFREVFDHTFVGESGQFSVLGSEMGVAGPLLFALIWLVVLYKLIYRRNKTGIWGTVILLTLCFVSAPLESFAGSALIAGLLMTFGLENFKRRRVRVDRRTPKLDID